MLYLYHYNQTDNEIELYHRLHVVYKRKQTYVNIISSVDLETKTALASTIILEWKNYNDKHSIISKLH